MIAFILFSIAVIVLSCAIGAITSRMCGGGKPDVPYGLDQFIYALPYALFGDGFYKAVSYAVAVFGKRLGHGQYHGIFGKRTPPENDEKFDLIVKLFFGEDRTSPDRWKRNVFGLFLSGIFPVLGACAVVAMQGHFIAAVLIFIGGSLKPVAYLLTAKTKYFTDGGEYLTGFFAWGFAAAAGILIYHHEIMGFLTYG